MQSHLQQSACARSALYRNRRRRRTHPGPARKFAAGKPEPAAQAIRTCRAICSSPPAPEAHFTEVWGGGGRNSELLSRLPLANLSGLHNQLQTCKAICSSPPCSRSAFYRNRRRRTRLGSARKFAFGKLERTAQVIKTCKAICSSPPCSHPLGTRCF